MLRVKRSPGPSSLSHFYAQGKNTILINIEKTTVPSNFMTQSLSGLKCTLASFFKPSQPCGGETRKIELFELPDLPRFSIFMLGLKKSPGLFYSQNVSNTVIGRWRLCWPLYHHFSMVAWASGLTCLPSR